MEVIFIALYRYFSSRRFLFIVLVLGFVLVALYFASGIKLEEDISKSMPGENDQIALVINNFEFLNIINDLQ